MKALFASFFLLVFSFQILPVKEIGKLLFKGTMTEEVHEAECGCDDTSEEGKLKKENDPYSNPQLAFYGSNFFTNKASTDNIMPDNLPKQYAPDIPTPPPNLIA